MAVNSNIKKVKEPGAIIAFLHKNSLFIAGLLLSLFAVNQFLAIQQESETFDEPALVLSGYLNVEKGDFRLIPTAPPLLGYMTYPFLKPLKPKLPELNNIGNPGMYTPLGKMFYYFSGNDARTLIFYSRIPLVILSVLLGFLMFVFVRTVFSPVAGVFAVFLFVFSQNLNAHSRIASEDMICAATMFAAVYFYYLLLEEPNIKRAVLAGFLTGIALISKYTALLLLPSFLIILTVHIFLSLENKNKVAKLIFLNVAGLLVMMFLIGASYNLTFDYRLYFGGLLRLYPFNPPGYFNYLAGMTSSEPFRYYCLAAFFIKTPLPLLILIFTAFFRIQYLRENIRINIFFLVPAGVMIAASFFDVVNLGIRRILPAYPFLIAFASGNIDFFLRDRRLKYTLIALLVWYSAAFYWVYPHNLAYFNELVGGPQKGPYYLNDSNVDWGQEMPGLKKWMDTNGVSKITLYYFGNGDPGYWGINYTPGTNEMAINPSPGYYAVSAHVLAFFRIWNRVYGWDSDWLGKYKPVGRVGYSIYIYKF